VIPSFTSDTYENTGSNGISSRVRWSMKKGGQWRSYLVKTVPSLCCDTAGRVTGGKSNL